MPSASASSKGRDGTPAKSGMRTWLGHRLTELVGFLVSVGALLVLLSLASYLPWDPSFNTSDAPAVGNWIGLWGSYTADALFQVLGWGAYVLPLAGFIVGIQMLRGRSFEAPATKFVGTLLLIGSLDSLLELYPYTPAIRGLAAGSVRGSGIAGYLLALGLRHTFNGVGAAIVAGTVFLSSLFLVTRFSFSAAFRFLIARFQFVRALIARWQAWREGRQRERLRREVERAKVAGKQPVVVQQRLSAGGIVADRKPVKAKAGSGATQDDRARPGSLLNLESDESGEGDEPEGEGSSRPLIVARQREPGERAATPKITGRGAQTYKLPAVTMLRPPEDQQGVDEDALKERAERLTEKFAEFGVTGTVTQIHPGPVVTTFEFKPEAGIKYSRITNLVDDLCLALKAESILIERIPGKSTVGIEVPNLHREIIHLRELVESTEFAASPSKLTICLGKDITGKMKVADLTQMPHLLIAGSTGSGKSVCINSLIISMLYKSTPDEVKLILIDPKRLELN